jgi:hypothetical protein
MWIKIAPVILLSAFMLNGCDAQEQEQMTPSSAVTDETMAEPEAKKTDSIDSDVTVALADEEKPALPNPLGIKPPRGKIAKCKITRADDIYQGPCRFQSEKGGSFSADMDDISGIQDDIISIGVAIIEQDKAEVRGLTKDGINSRWGEAQRSETDRACWTGVDFEICAY